MEPAHTAADYYYWLCGCCGLLLLSVTSSLPNRLTPWQFEPDWQAV